MRKSHLFTTLFIALSIVLIAFASPAEKATASVVNAVAVKTPVAEAAPAVESLSTQLYKSLQLQSKGLSKDVLDAAIKGYEKLVAEGSVNNAQYLTVIDFTQSGRKKRVYLIDMENRELVMNTFVSHGKNTGLDMATKFSNTPNSEQSSLGFYVTGPTYTGKHGMSLRLIGKEDGYNSNAMARGIVVHGAEYVNAGRVNSAFMGRSQGCPALPMNEYAKAINFIKGGSVMFIYSDKNAYLQQSPVLNG